MIAVPGSSNDSICKVRILKRRCGKSGEEKKKVGLLNSRSDKFNLESGRKEPLC